MPARITDHTPFLLADYRADRRYRIEAGTVVEDGAGTLAEHAGLLALPASPEALDLSEASAAPEASGGPSAPARRVFADDLRGALTVLEGRRERQIPIAIPAEHLAADPAGRHVVVTTGVGMNAAPWSDVVTVVDVAAGRSRRFRSRVGEPGVVVVADRATGRDTIVLRHREPGAVEAIDLAAAAAVGARVPELRGPLCTDLADDGHGDVVDHAHGIVAVATGRGVERFVVEDGRPRALGIVPWPVAGRAYYLRWCAATGRALGVVRGGPQDPARWQAWTNHLVSIDLDRGTTTTAPLPDGLAFRFGLAPDRAAVATVHPDGDRLTVLGREPEALCEQWSTPLPGLSRPPRPGRVPWDPAEGEAAQRRAVAVCPTTGTVAVTRGGDAELHLLRDRKAVTLTLPTPVDEGGVLHSLHAAADTVGR